MSVTHSLDDRLLMGYAAGLLPEAYDLIVATAVSLDDDARARLSMFEAMGGALLETQDIAPLRDTSFEDVMKRIGGAAPEDTVSDAKRVPVADAVFPQPLRDAIGSDLAQVAWRNLGMGVRQAAIPCWDGQATSRLLQIPAGQAMPDHGHEGVELTLVLQGAFRDGSKRYARGDISIADDTVEHRPIADLGDDCICLVVMDAPLRFRSILPRIASRFMDI